MLEQLLIKNFQKHKNLKVEFDPAITTLVGKTGSGKSSVLRALRWLCFNRPHGEQFVTHGEDLCRVSLLVEGQKITRIRSHRENLYYLNKQKYEAFGNAVPEDIQEAIDLPETNFEGQFDNPFWFLKTGGELAKELNKIIDLEQMDILLSVVTQDLKEAESEVKISNERLVRYEQVVSKLAWVQEAQKDLDHLDSLSQNLVLRRQELSRISDLVKGVQRYDLRKKVLSEAILDAKKVVQKGWGIQELREKLTQMGRVKAKIDYISTQIKDVESRVKSCWKVLESMETCPLCGTPKRSWPSSQLIPISATTSPGAGQKNRTGTKHS